VAFDVWSREKVTTLSAIFLLMLSPSQPDVTRTELKPLTLQAFDAYIRQAEARLDSRDAADYLWCDGTPVRKDRIRKGEVLAEPWIGSGDIEIPGGLIHDWVASVFIPGVTLAKTLALVQDYNNHKAIYKPEVIDSRLIAHNGNDYKVKLRLLKKQVITVVLNTDHEVRYRPLDATHCSSRSYSTRVAEVEDAGSTGERELPPGNDHGFLWRLNSYWRFQERDGGVYVECEAISLTRDVPAGLGWLINPIVRRLPRQSLANTLSATRAALTR
jgi:hypothetical protein